MISILLGMIYVDSTSSQHVVCYRYCFMLRMNEKLPAVIDHFMIAESFHCLLLTPPIWEPLAFQYSKLHVKSSHLRNIFSNSDVQSEIQIHRWRCTIHRCKMQIQWVCGFQCVSIHSPSVILQPFVLPRFSISCLRFGKRQRQFCLCSFIHSWEPLSLTPEAC